MIDWRPPQQRLHVAPDGLVGRATYAALFTHMGPKAAPATVQSLANAAAVHFAEYGISASVERLADFLAQTANETGGFTTFSENLNYRAERMLAIWPRHFTADLARWAQGYPERVAEVAYGVKSRTGKGRMGNDQPGWGYLYRGRGMLQLTGRDNYVATDRRLGIGLDTNPELAAVPALSLLIACDFYRNGNVLAALDRGDTTRAREITNGGRIGLEEVNALRKRALAVLS